MRAFRVAMAVGLLVCLSPLLSTIGADIVARLWGCTLDLASVHPCIVGGQDIGHGLLTLGMMGYFLFATLPVAAAIAGAWIVAEIIAWGRRRAA